MHNRIRIISLILVFIFVFSMIMVVNNQDYSVDAASTGNEIYVDARQHDPEAADGTQGNPYATIQDGIDNANDGDTINVLHGKYRGDLTIDKSVKIIGENIKNTFFVSLSDNSYMIDVSAPSVSIEGFTIWDKTPTVHRKAIIHLSEGADDFKLIGSALNYSKHGYGIQVEGANNVTIFDNTINNTNGISIEGSKTAVVSNNIIQNSTGIYLIRLVNSNHNIIENNNITNSSHYLIYGKNISNNKLRGNSLGDSANRGVEIVTGQDNIFENSSMVNISGIGIDLGSSDSRINNTYISGVGTGIKIKASNADVKNNTLHSCTSYGVYVEYGSNSKIYNNTFLYNYGEQHGRDITNNANNKWYNESTKLGNYWDDFFGPDPSNVNNTVVYDNETVPEVYKYKKGGVIDFYPKGCYNEPPVISLPVPSVY